MNKNAVKEVVDLFLKMCDFIEKSNDIGCIKCPVQKECFKDKHSGLPSLMLELGIERKEL